MPGIGLDDRGRDQAAAVGARLADVPLDAIISSPLQRCRETAAAIAAARNGHQVAVTEDDRFAEVAYGDWTGKPIKRLAKEPLWRVVQAHPSAVRFPGPGGESLPGVQERAVAAIRDWNARLGPKAVYLVCSHGDVIKSIIADSLGLHLDMFQRIQVDPCSVSLIRYTPLRPFVVRMNDTGAGMGGLAKPEPAAGGPSQAAGAAAGRPGWARAMRLLVAGREDRDMAVYSYDSPERFVAGTVGQPGQRTFYLQASVRRPGDQRGRGEVPGEPAGGADRRAAGRGTERHRRAGRRAPPRPGLADDGPLDLPLTEDFRVGAIALAGTAKTSGWSSRPRRRLRRRSSRSPRTCRRTGPGVLRVRLSPAAARAFSKRAIQIVGQGRPPCPLCGLPLDAEGHICPRQNGHRVSNA